MISHSISTDRFTGDLVNGDPQDPKFFASIIQRAPQNFRVTMRELATLLEVSPPSITRWAQGRCMPHLAMRKSVIKLLLARNKRLRNSGQRPPSSDEGNLSVPRRTPSNSANQSVNAKYDEPDERPRFVAGEAHSTRE
jgi:transcriptional regulator with XRE-family HTH domain